MISRKDGALARSCRWRLPRALAGVALILLPTLDVRGQDGSLQGWVKFPPPTLQSEAMRCANYSDRVWSVSAKDGHLQITRALQQPAAPHDLSFDPEAAGISVRRGSRIVLEPVATGQLVGVDSGEYGGGLWWVAKDGKHSRRLLDDNVLTLFRLKGELFCLTGLAHMGERTGSVFRVARCGDDWEVHRAADLHDRPGAHLVQGDGTALILTGSALLRFTPPAKLDLLKPVAYRLLTPYSMVELPSGELYVGLRHFVTRLTPSSGGYAEEWFVPKDCTAFAVVGHVCQCK